MPIEIERKFLLANEDWRKLIRSSEEYLQGYLIGSEKASVRIRLEGNKAFLNIKSATLGVTRKEYQYPIAIDEAREILETLCAKPLITKIRHKLVFKGHEWEIDEFGGDNEGLIVAEIELQNVNEIFDKPEWLGKEVSSDTRYYNVSLVNYPYKEWSKRE